MKYLSTRNNDNIATASQAILSGIADDGGLYSPESLPDLRDKWQRFINMSYQETAFALLTPFLNEFSPQALKESLNKAYSHSFHNPVIAPVNEINGLFFLELFHGPTLAFKDIALLLLPHLIRLSANIQKLPHKTVLVTATSGDTGKAALNAFADVEGSNILVFYPQKGVSDIQKLQMTTQQGKNTFVAAISGNFDDAQAGVKQAFADEDFTGELLRCGYQLTTANSINIGRLLPQIVYYFYAYCNLVQQAKIEAGETVNVVVPTGNFGNILALFYAKKMGLPIHKLICASNANNVLSVLFTTGTYTNTGCLALTASPSMDILAASNLERLLFEICLHDSEPVAYFASQIANNRSFSLPQTMRNNLEDFYGNWASDAETAVEINSIFQSTGYVIDPHTAVACAVLKKYRHQTADCRQTIIAATASPFKFAKTVLSALGKNINKSDEFELVQQLAATARLDVPNSISTLQNLPILHNSVYAKNDIKYAIKKFLMISGD